MGGISVFTFVSKFVGKSDLAKPVVKLSHCYQYARRVKLGFVNKMMFKTVAKGLNADVMEYTILQELRNDEKLKGKNAYGEPYEIIYRPPGYELVDETTGKAVKTPGDLQASDTQFRRTGPEIDDYDVDGEV